jgi:hypothetical protein
MVTGTVIIGAPPKNVAPFREANAFVVALAF